MMVLVTYDVNTQSAEGRRRLRNVAKICENFGQRVQNSVFECLLDPAQWVAMRSRLKAAANLEQDSLRFYFLGKNYKRRLEHIGAKPGYDPEGLLVV